MRPAAFSSWQRAFTQSFGTPATTNEIHEIRRMKCLLLIGANAPETHAITSYWMNIAVRTHGDPAALIVIDPQWNLLCDVANVWLRPKPGTDGVLLFFMISGYCIALSAASSTSCWHFYAKRLGRCCPR